MGSASCASGRLLPDPALGQKGSCLNFSGAGKVSFSLVSRGWELAHTRALQHSAQVDQVPLWSRGMCQILWKPPLAKSLWDASFPLLADPFLGSCLDPGQALCVMATFALLPNSLFRLLCLFLSLFLSVGVCLEQAAFAGGDLGRCGSFLPFLRHS